MCRLGSGGVTNDEFDARGNAMTWATDRLDALVAGEAEPPPVIKTLRLGTLDAWGHGWARKHWAPQPELLQADGSMFGGYLAAMADQMLAFAALTVVPEGKGFRTIGLSVQFFQLLRNEAIDVEARVVSQSRQVISVEADFLNASGERVAKATAQQVVTELSRP
jgi:uncharacterized protein (TIGR00369 family)